MGESRAECGCDRFRRERDEPKADEVYGSIEKMCPGGQQIEIFGRKHDTIAGVRNFFADIIH